MVKFDQEIQPGEEGKISLSVTVHEDWAGEEFNKRALVTTNDVNHQRFILSLTGQVVAAASAAPEEEPAVDEPTS